MAKKLKAAMLLLILALVNLLMPSFFVVLAQDIENNASGIVDFYLYNELLILVNQNAIEPVYSLKTNSLAHLESLTITHSQIASLQGLDLLDLSNVKTLDLSFNQITQVSAQNLSSLTSLEQINLSNNRLTQIDIGELINLNRVLLANNKLTQIDLQQIVYHPTLGAGYANLSNNEFIDIQNILLPQDIINPISIDAHNNYLLQTNIFDYVAPHTIELLFQGVKHQQALIQTSIIALYPSAAFGQVYVKVFDTQSQTELYELLQGEQIALEPGNFTLKFFEEQQELEISLFIPISFIVRPYAPNVQLLQNEQLIGLEEVYKQSVTLLFEGQSEQAVIQYSINSSPSQVGNVVEISKNGRYRIFVWALENGVTSEMVIVEFRISNTWQAAINVFKAIGSLVLLILMLAAGRYYFIKTKNTA